MKFKLKNIILFSIVSIFISGCNITSQASTYAINNEPILIEHEETYYRPMVMIDGILYISTGEDSDIKARCGMLDGEIISEVEPNEKPESNNQSNFGTGYGYQFVEGGIDVYMPKDESNENYWIRFIKESEDNKTANCIGILAHIKEIKGDSILISSDTDDFPGAFSVIGFEEMTNYAELKEGMFIQILMQNLYENDKQGLPKYRVKNIIIEGEEDIGYEDILLTDVPLFILTDPLSSTINSFEIKSKNHSWNVKENGKLKNIESCGLSPLKEAGIDSALKLNLPKYNRMDSIPYLFSTVIAPDILTVSQWGVSDIDNVDAKKQSITTYYYKTPILELEGGKVYEFVAEWKKENFDKNNFYGTASYVLITE